MEEVKCRYIFCAEVRKVPIAAVISASHMWLCLMPSASHEVGINAVVRVERHSDGRKRGEYTDRGSD